MSFLTDVFPDCFKKIYLPINLYIYICLYKTYIFAYQPIYLPTFRKWAFFLFPKVKPEMYWCNRLVLPWWTQEMVYSPLISTLLCNLWHRGPSAILGKTLLFSVVYHSELPRLWTFLFSMESLLLTCAFLEVWCSKLGDVFQRTS